MIWFKYPLLGLSTFGVVSVAYEIVAHVGMASNVAILGWWTRRFILVIYSFIKNLRPTFVWIWSRRICCFWILLLLYSKLQCLMINAGWLSDFFPEFNPWQPDLHYRHGFLIEETCTSIGIPQVGIQYWTMYSHAEHCGYCWYIAMLMSSPGIISLQYNGTWVVVIFRSLHGGFQNLKNLSCTQVSCSYDWVIFGLNGNFEGLSKKAWPVRYAPYWWDDTLTWSSELFTVNLLDMAS